MLNLKWWQKAVIYEVYVKSFYDSNGDGYGDLVGVSQKLDYLKNLGITTVWLSPIYPSAHKDNGYDITSFVDIDPLYGSMKDFEDLVDLVHRKGMYIILDFIPNHTSDEHEWFKKSCASNSVDNPYRDYYVWYQSEDRHNPPNNWVSVFEKRAWTYNETRKAWYHHQFLSSQPELNWRCEAVKKEIEQVIKFWLEEKKVDGLRIDALKHLFENENFENEPLRESVNPYTQYFSYDQLHHIHTTNLPETYELVAEWKQLLDEIGKRTNTEKFMVSECYETDIKAIMNYYRYNDRECCHFSFNFQLVFLYDGDEEKNPVISRSYLPFNPYVIKSLMDPWIENLREGYWTNWQIGNHDYPRLASRIGRSNVDLANVLCLLLGGTATVYYGEEIGMSNLPSRDLSYEDCQDDYGKKQGPNLYRYFTRDYQRTPMQWNAAINAGFTRSNVKPWLPVNHDHKFVNVEKQLKEKRSHLSIYKDLLKLRKEASFSYGDFKYGPITDKLFSFFRHAQNNPTFLVALNLSDEDIFVDFSNDYFVPVKAKIKYFIGRPFESEAIFDLYKPGNFVSTCPIHLKSKNCIILSF